MYNHRINKYPVSSFFLGESDGKNEANYNVDFVKYYYKGAGYHEKLLLPKYWLVLGRKGMGKSLLGRYFYANLNKNFDFSKIISYSDFKYSLLHKLEDGDIEPNQYISIWKFLLYIYLGKEILKDLSLEQEREYSVLKDFIDKNFELNLDQNKILETVIKREIKGELLGIGGGGGKENKEEFGNYLNYLSKLKNTILNLVNKSKNNYYLILDQLDDRFRRNDNNKDALISLIKATNDVNISLFQQNSNSKVIVLLRTDIFTFLKDTDLNKIKSDNGIIMNRESKISIHSDLLKMLIYKIQQSKEEFKSENYASLFDMIFPQKVNGFNPEKFLLERTFFRPRDIIAYIKLIVEKYPHTKYIGAKAFLDAEKEYSKYLLNEIENELIGHHDNDFIDEGFKLLKQFRRSKFTFIEIQDFYNQNKSRFKNIELEKLLEAFFESGILGNSRNNNGKQYYTSIIRDDRSIIDFSKEFVLHLGLRTAVLY